MNSEIFKTLGIDNIDPAFIFLGIIVLFIGFLVWNIILVKKNKKLNKRIDKFLKGKDAKSLEDILSKRFEEVDTLIASDKTNKTQIKDIQENLLNTFQKSGIVKYDAFSEMGGKLSFSLAMLDKTDNGFIINSMHSREGCYTYIKEIIKGESYIPLGEEEKKALKMAMEISE